MLQCFTDYNSLKYRQTFTCFQVSTSFWCTFPLLNLFCDSHCSPRFSLLLHISSFFPFLHTRYLLWLITAFTDIPVWDKLLKVTGNIPFLMQFLVQVSAAVSCGYLAEFFDILGNWTVGLFFPWTGWRIYVKEVFTMEWLKAGLGLMSVWVQHGWMEQVCCMLTPVCVWIKMKSKG